MSQAVISPLQGSAPYLVGGALLAAPYIVRAARSERSPVPAVKEALDSIDREAEGRLGQRNWSVINDVFVDNAWIGFGATHLLVRDRQSLSYEDMGKAGVFFLGVTALAWVTRYAVSKVVGNWFAPRGA